MMIQFLPGPGTDLESFALIPNEYFGAACLTSFSASSGLYAPGAGVTKPFGSLGLICIVGALGSSLPEKSNFNIRYLMLFTVLS